MEYLSHSLNEMRSVNLLTDHLRDVASRAAKYAEGFNCSKEAMVASVLHDLGKYGDLFQRRLKGGVKGIDHWSAGAWFALMKYKAKGIAIALTIQGHHLGLQSAYKDDIKKMDISKLYRESSAILKLSEEDINVLLKRFEADGLKLPDGLEDSIYDQRRVSSAPSGEMLGIRILFSALVDADFVATEAHFNAVEPGKKLFRKEGQKLNVGKAIDILNQHIEKLNANTSASEAMTEMRAKLRHACLKAAEQPSGLFTLTAPTGSGKTLSMLTFALEHARRKNKSRIIIVLPYLSIIEQTARIYRDIFTKVFGDDFIIENHSLSGKRDEKDENVNDIRNKFDFLAENWDAPLIITTSVQLLESLHSNRPFACRKLHRLANSVVLLDEVQTLPLSMAMPTLASLSALSVKFGTTVVFSTATQPAFSHLHDNVKKCYGMGWQPREIVPAETGLFNIVSRTRLHWESNEEKVSWSELAESISKSPQALCIVNIKRHATELFDTLKKSDGRCVCHLSTNMCPAHRENVLKCVKSRLKSERDCILISTQCVEAGVDIDFPIVYRAMAPLDSIAQAAGRCNRNGRADSGKVVVFTPEDNRYPDGVYEQAAAVTSMLFKKHNKRLSNIENPELFEEYYKELYSFNKLEEQNKELREAIIRLDFADTAKLYRLIRANTINIVVPYKMDVYKQLKAEAQAHGVKSKWIKEARPHAVSIYMPRDDNPVWNFLEPAHPDDIKRYKMTDERWYFYTDASHYDASKGLIPPDDDCIIA